MLNGVLICSDEFPKQSYMVDLLIIKWFKTIRISRTKENYQLERPDLNVNWSCLLTSYCNLACDLPVKSCCCHVHRLWDCLFNWKCKEHVHSIQVTIKPNSTYQKTEHKWLTHFPMGKETSVTDILLVIHYYQVESWDNSAFTGSHPKENT